MAIMFNKIPSEKPRTEIEPGKYTATIIKTEVGVSKSGNNMLTITLKLDENGISFKEFFVEPTENFSMWKIGQLLVACGVALEGEGTLKDIAKIVMNKKVVVDVNKNDRGYAQVDYSGNNEGLSPIEESTTTSLAEDTDVAEAINNDENF